MAGAARREDRVDHRLTAFGQLYAKPCQGQPFGQSGRRTTLDPGPRSCPRTIGTTMGRSAVSRMRPPPHFEEAHQYARRVVHEADTFVRDATWTLDDGQLRTESFGLSVVLEKR